MIELSSWEVRGALILSALRALAYTGGFLPGKQASHMRSQKAARLAMERMPVSSARRPGPCSAFARKAAAVASKLVGSRPKKKLRAEAHRERVEVAPRDDADLTQRVSSHASRVGPHRAPNQASDHGADHRRHATAMVFTPILKTAFFAQGDRTSPPRTFAGSVPSERTAPP